MLEATPVHRPRRRVPVQIEGAPRVTALQLHPCGKRLLAVTADMHLRTYLLHRPGDRQPLRGPRRLAQAAASWPSPGIPSPAPTTTSAASGASGAGGQGDGEQQGAPGPRQWAQQSLEEARSLVARPSRFRHSLFFGEGQAWLTQLADFQGEGGSRGRPFRCAAYCTGGWPRDAVGALGRAEPSTHQGTGGQMGQGRLAGPSHGMQS